MRINTNELQQKIEDIIKILRVYSFEIQEIESKRKSLEASELVNSERERKIYTQEIDLNKRRADIDSQKRYLEKMNDTTSLNLAQIIKEKEKLQILIDQKKSIEEEKHQLDVEKIILLKLREEIDQYQVDKKKLEEEKVKLERARIALREDQELLDLRGKSLFLRESRLPPEK